MRAVTRRQLFLSLFFLHLILGSFYLDTWRNPNTTSRVLQVIALEEHGVLYIDGSENETLDKAFVNDHYYPLQPPFPTLALYPAYKFLKMIGAVSTDRQKQYNAVFLIGSFLFGSLPFALLILLLFHQLLEVGKSLTEAFVLSSLPVYGSMFFVYSGTFFSHILVCYLLALSLHFITKNKQYLLSGFLCGAAFFSEYLTAVIIAIWFFLIWKREAFKNAVHYAAGLLPFIVSFFLYNYFTTGNLFLTPYSFNLSYEMEDVGFSYPRPAALIQLFFTPWRGAVFYVPVLVTLAWFAIQQKFDWKRVFWDNYMVLPALVFILTLSAYEEWHGGWTFGPRYLFPALVLFLYGGLKWISFKGFQGFWFWIPVFFGLVYSLMAKATVLYSIPSKYSYPLIQYVWPKLSAGEWNEGHLLFLTGLSDRSLGNILFPFLLTTTLWLFRRWLKSIQLSFSY